MSLFNKFLDKTIHRKKSQTNGHIRETDHVGASVDANEFGHDAQPQYEARSSSISGLNTTPAATTMNAPMDYTGISNNLAGNVNSMNAAQTGGFYGSNNGVAQEHQQQQQGKAKESEAKWVPEGE
ncbi:hypothetical protein EC968_001726 [Mortierella alpina]|nr:hypothetical protein EC968_001726 [Mortierella alpina]